MARELQIAFDCGDPAGLVVFWAEALGYRLQDPPARFESWDQALEAMGVPVEQRNDASAAVAPAGSGQRLFFQRVPEGKQARNRVHLDVRAAPGPEGDARMGRPTSSASTDCGSSGPGCGSPWTPQSCSAECDKLR